MSIPPRFEISADEIGKVVAVFYARIRAHAVLGEVFAAHVTDWPEHEAKIANFWRNAILLERSYSGNPMRKHMAAGNVHGEHFPQWLAIFDEVLGDTVSEDQAAAWSALAHRIGQGLRFGLETYVRVPNGDQVPRF
ncbi:group III truncated hemoglobin [Yoonia sp. MH D7]